MFGHLPLIIKEVILSHGGQEKWENLLRKLGMSQDFNETQIYDERVLEELINEAPSAIIELIKCCLIIKPSTINRLDCRREAFMEMLGEAYLANMMAKGQGQIIRSLGGTFYEFVQNLDFLHTVAMAKYPKADIPLFRMEDSSAGGNNRIRLHYYSRREFLSRMVESLLRCVGRTIFRKDIGIQIVSEQRDEDRYHVIYSVTVGDFCETQELPPTMVAQTRKHGENQLHEKDVEREKEKLDHLKMEFGEDSLPVSQFRQAKARVRNSAKMNVLYAKTPPRIPSQLGVSAEDFCELFPYHVVFDANMNLRHAGVQMQFIISEFREENENITRHLDLVHPGKVEFTFHNVQKYICCPHVVKTRHNNLTNDFSQKGAVVYFRGQMVEISNKRYILYLCSPYVHNLDTVEHFGMHVSDIPTHDVTKYLLQGSSATESFKRRTNKGDWLEGFLGLNGQPIFSEDLDDTGDSRYSMVPRGIVDQLKSGRKVDGKTYRNCSILFCDLVQFGTLVERCSPSEVLTLINDLHDRFDKLALLHDVFKVDVIGDAYVIVSGIPNMVRNHAERIAKMSLGMMQVCKTIACPYNYGGNIGARVLSRIGLHSGDVIGGIIGRTVQRFTIMGENVILASRLESHGVPDRVHLSEAMNSELKPYHFEIEARGNIEIRGKGRLFTYLLKEGQSISRDELLGEKTGAVADNYPLPMSPSTEHGADYSNRKVGFNPSEAKDGAQGQRAKHGNAHLPRHMRPKSGKGL